MYHPKSEDWLKEFKELKAYWIHDGNPKRPHPEISSGLHGKEYFNGSLILNDTQLRSMVAADLTELLRRTDYYLEVNAVAGPPTGGTKLANSISNKISINRAEHTRSVSPEKIDDGGDKRMEFRDMRIDKDERFIICDDVLTTGDSIRLLAKAITDSGGVVLPFILVVANCSGKKEIDGRKVLSLIDHPTVTWKAEDCPMCKEGSTALRPKENWEKFVATY